MYLNFYGLKENPFNVTSDPAFLYLSDTHKEALDHLIYGIETRKGFIEITGEIGSGKTTLCKALLSKISKNTTTSLILNSNLPEIQLLEAVLMDFGLTVNKRTKGMLIKELNDFLLLQLSKNKNVVLIIDEAQNLKKNTLETIRMLSNLETDKEKLLQIVLVGQPELREKLSLPELEQLKQRISVRFHLAPLKGEEVKEYLTHRLLVAGSSGKIVFSDSGINLIKEFSKGIPRIINIICDKALLLGFVEGVFLITDNIMERSIAELEGNFHMAAVSR